MKNTNTKKARNTKGPSQGRDDVEGTVRKRKGEKTPQGRDDVAGKVGKYKGEKLKRAPSGTVRNTYKKQSSSKLKWSWSFKGTEAKVDTVTEAP